jgi:Ca-activated chloride channel family protein
MPLEKFKPNNLVFVLDVSSSMRILGRMELLKKAMIQLTAALREADRVSIITFSTIPVLRIKGIPGNQKDTLNGIIHSLSAAGATYGIRGLRFAYELAEKNFIPDGNNTVIIATDGEFPQTDEHGTDIQIIIRDYLEKNIKLSVMAFGRDAEALKSMEKMATKGAGGYMRMDGTETPPERLLQQSER